MLLVNLFKIFNDEQRNLFYRLQILVVIGSILEIVSIGLIAILMKLIADLESTPNSFVGNTLYKYFNISSSEEIIFLFGIFTLFVLVISTIFSIFSVWRMSIFAHKIGVDIGDSLYSYYMRKPIIFHKLNNSSYLTKQIATESNRVTTGIIVPFMHVNARIIVTLLLIIMVFMYDKWAAIYGSLFFLVVYLSMYRFVRSKLSDNGEKVSESTSQRYKYMSEGFHGVRDLTILNKVDYFINMFKYSGETLAKSQGANQVLTLIPKYVIEFIIFGMIIFLTIYLVSKEGDIQSSFPILTVYAFSAFKLLPAFQQIYTSLTLVRANGPAFYSIKDDLIMAMSREKYCEPLVENNQNVGLIEFKDISFRYPDTEKLALKNISLKIPQGACIGFVGHSGSGKSTIVDALSGFIHPCNGGIYNANVEINSKNIRSWQNSISYVSQNIFLLDASIVDNITLEISKNKVDKERLRNIINMVDLRDFIAQLPDGWNTSVGERGAMISGGQLQRIGIARALYRDSSLIIFDEATSALDGITESKIMKSINSFYGKKTIVIIAHRLKTVKKCDLIYVLDEGEVADRGTYSELVKTNKQFKEMSELS